MIGFPDAFSQDAGVHGPEAAVVEDIPSLVRIHWDSRHDLMGGRLPPQPRQAWAYALKRDRVDVWRDLSGTVVGFVVARLAGVEGALVTVPLDAKWRDLGIRSAMVRSAVNHLEEAGARRVITEALPQYSESLGAALHFGFLPDGITVHFGWPVPTGDSLCPKPPVSRWDQAPACLALTELVSPGLDLAAELRVTQEQEIGGLTVAEHDGAVQGFAVWHNQRDLGMDVIRVRALVASGESGFEETLSGLQALVSTLPFGFLTLGAQDAPAWACDRLLARGFRVGRADARLVRGTPRFPPGKGVAWVRWRL